MLLFLKILLPDVVEDFSANVVEDPSPCSFEDHFVIVVVIACSVEVHSADLLLVEDPSADVV